MSALDFLLIVCILIAAGALLYHSLRKQWNCSGCSGCSCGHKKPAVKVDALSKK
jgi:hypothetical protein